MLSTAALNRIPTALMLEAVVTMALRLLHLLQVNELRKKLAVRMLQLEMELVYACLEEEVIQITGETLSARKRFYLLPSMGDHIQQTE